MSNYLNSEWLDTSPETLNLPENQYIILDILKALLEHAGLKLQLRTSLYVSPDGIAEDSGLEYRVTSMTPIEYIKTKKSKK